MLSVVLPFSVECSICSARLMDCHLVYFLRETGYWIIQSDEKICMSNHAWEYLFAIICVRNRALSMDNHSNDICGKWLWDGQRRLNCKIQFGMLFTATAPKNTRVLFGPIWLFSSGKMHGKKASREKQISARRKFWITVKKLMHEGLWNGQCRANQWCSLVMKSNAKASNNSSFVCYLGRSSLITGTSL